MLSQISSYLTQGFFLNISCCFFQIFSVLYLSPILSFFSYMLFLYEYGFNCSL